MKKNICFVLLGELILFLLAFAITLMLCEDPRGTLSFFFDFPSLLLISVILIPGLLITGEWKDFIKAFSVGAKHYSLLELKNIIIAVGTAQKLTLYGALFAMITSAICFMGNLSDFTAYGPNLVLIFLAALYAAIIEFLLMPLRLNAERRMNEEMDLEDGED